MEPLPITVQGRYSLGLCFASFSAKAKHAYVLFYTTKRVGGGVQDFAAIKLLKFA